MKKKLVVVVPILILVIVSIALLVKFLVLDSTASQSKPTHLTDITVRLKWLHQSQFAGNYIADKKGLYEQAGLRVTLNSFDYSHYPIDEVLKGSADFGITGADELLIARSQGKKIKALAVIYQENPVIAYALASSGIKTPVDFIGKKLGLEAGVNVETVIKAMLTAQGIRYDQIGKVIPIQFDVTPVLDHTVDIGTGYITNEPISVEEAGQKVNVIAPYEYGVKLYADVLFTTDAMIDSKPEIVQKFVTATLAGWDYALDHIDEAINITLEYKDPNNSALNFAHQKALLLKSIPFIKPSAGRKIGDSTYLNWQRTYQLLRDYKNITTDLDVTTAYTTKFIQ
jgi:NitT/TauT family transport system substrate-binding protein